MWAPRGVPILPSRSRDWRDHMKPLTFAAGLMLATAAVAETPVLTVYAPDYFVSEWGPGPKIEELFEALWVRVIVHARIELP